MPPLLPAGHDALPTMFALKRGAPALSRASSSGISPVITIPRRCMASDSGSSSSLSTLDDILGSMSSAPPRSPFSQLGTDHLPKSRRIPAAPIAPYPEGRRTSLLGDDYEDQAARAFGKNLSAPAPRGRKRRNSSPATYTLPDTVTYKLYVLARSKSCIMTLVDENNAQRGGMSAGQCGFKNSAEGSYEAGYQCAVRVLDMLRKEIERRRGEVEVSVEVMLNGFGQGRGALVKALSMAEGDGIRDAVVRVTDKTPIRVGGVRLQKKRRL